MICSSQRRVQSPVLSQRPAAALIEFIIVSAFIVAVVVGMCELGRGVNIREILDNAARRGCRTGSLPSKTGTDISNDVKDVLTLNNIDATMATITIKVNDVVYDPGTTWSANTGDKISVLVSVPVSKAMWSGTIFLKQLNSETIVMMRQG